jgi:molybdopterin molybdotransferase
MSTEGPPALVPVEVHLADALAAIRPIQPVTVPLEAAEGGVLAADVTASTALPPFDNSAMDGYAVQAKDLAAASGDHPVRLPVRGEIAAGDTGSYQVDEGTCLRIMTGALMPAGADAVVPVEWTDGGPRSRRSAARSQWGTHSGIVAVTWPREPPC